MQSNKGNVTVIAIIVVVAVIAAGILGWVLGKNANNAQLADENEQAEQQVQPVRQINDESDQRVKNDFDYFLIPEAGIKFRTPASLKNDLVYTVKEETMESDMPKTQLIGLTSKTLIRDGGDECRDSGLGYIVKVYANFTKDALYVDATPDEHWSMTKKGLENAGAVQFDNFFVYFVKPQDVCADKNTPAIESALDSVNVILQAFKSAEIIK